MLNFPFSPVSPRGALLGAAATSSGPGRPHCSNARPSPRGEAAQDPGGCRLEAAARSLALPSPPPLELFTTVFWARFSPSLVLRLLTWLQPEGGIAVASQPARATRAHTHELVPPPLPSGALCLPSLGLSLPVISRCLARVRGRKGRLCHATRAEGRGSPTAGPVKGKCKPPLDNDSHEGAAAAAAGAA